MDVLLLFSIPMVLVVVAIALGDRGGRRPGRRGDATGRMRRRRVEEAGSGGFPHMNSMG